MATAMCILAAIVNYHYRTCNHSMGSEVVLFTNLIAEVHRDDQECQGRPTFLLQIFWMHQYGWHLSILLSNSN